MSKENNNDFVRSYFNDNNYFAMIERYLWKVVAEMRKQ